MVLSPLLRIAVFLIATLCWAGHSFAQSPVAVFGGGAIPEQGFTSWSLFLPCNPTWVQDKQAAVLRGVFDAYVSLGRTTGARHAGVWFVTGHQPAGPARTVFAQDAANLDVERSVAYCQRFKLVPSEGPHVVVLTTHPDKWTGPSDGSTPAGDPMVTLALGDTDSRDISRLFEKLTDQIHAERLSQKPLTSSQYWLSWVRVLETGCKLFDKAKFTVTAKFVQVEKTGICS